MSPNFLPDPEPGTLVDRHGHVWPITGYWCARCGMPLSRVLAADGETTHPTCGAWAEYGTALPGLNDALAVAGEGYPVFPLRGKLPAVRGGVQAATSHPSRLRTLWANGRRANIGAALAGIAVLDVDPRNGGSLTVLESIAGIPLATMTRTVYSGRNDGGVHLHFRHPGGELSAAALTGIDLKQGAHAYVVMPPSLHPDTGKPYTWGPNRRLATMPTLLVDALRPPLRGATSPAPATGTGDRWGGLVHTVATAPESTRDNALYWAGCRAADDNAPEHVWEALQRAAEHVGLTPSEARATLASARKRAREAA